MMVNKPKELLTKIVQQSIRLGVEVTTHVDHVLRKVYWGTNKFPKHFEWLDEYIAHPESQSSIFEAIKELTEKMEKVANKPMTQNIHLELVNKKGTNIGTNYGPNIEHNGGTLTLPNKDDK